MNRVVLINKKCAPSREELVTSERRTGELMFAEFPTLDFAGYVIPEGGKRAANWIIPENIAVKFYAFARKIVSDEYEIRVFTDGKTPHGGQCEVRII